MIYLKVPLIALLSVFLGCQDYNSNTFDEDRYGKLDLEQTSTKFEPAYRVLQKRCISCHTHATWAEYKNERDWENQGLVVVGFPNQSSLIRRTINSGVAGADMPYGGGAIPKEEYDALTNWITGPWP